MAGRIMGKSSKPSTAGSSPAGRSAAIQRSAMASTRDASSGGAADVQRSAVTSRSIQRKAMVDEAANVDAADSGLIGTPSPGASTSDLLSDFDSLLEMLEERILMELERRGGRYRGDF